MDWYFAKNCQSTLHNIQEEQRINFIFEDNQLQAHLVRVKLQQNKTLNNTDNSVRREERVGRISKPFPTHIFPTIIFWYIYKILAIMHNHFYMSREGKSACRACPETQQVVHLQLELLITGYQ